MINKKKYTETMYSQLLWKLWLLKNRKSNIDMRFCIYLVEHNYTKGKKYVN